MWIRYTPLSTLLLAAYLLGAPIALAGFSLTTTAAPEIAVTLNGSDQTVSYSMDLTVDNSGLGSTSSGWHLTITSTLFSTGGATPRTLSAGASSVTALTSLCAVGPCIDPANSSSYPIPVSAGSPAPTPLRFFSTPALTGLGTFTLTPIVTVEIPASAYAGAYASTLTLALTSGP